MPIPFLVAGAAAVAGATGAVKTTQAHNKQKQAKEILEHASSIYDTATRNLESQKNKTTTILETLGEQRIKSWSKDMTSFLGAFDSFKNVEMRGNVAIDSAVLNQFSSPKEMLVDMKSSALNATEMAQLSSASLGAGAVVGVAAYGGAMMLGYASTGAAIAGLHGAAAKNALLAWFGGGAKAVGGLGVAGGKWVLGGIVAAPILAVSGLILDAKAKEKLANAEMIRAEAKEAAEKMGIMETTLAGIGTIAADYTSFIKEVGVRLNGFTKELNKISKRNRTGSDKVDFSQLSEKEQKTLHLSWLLAQVYYHLLSAPLLDDEGKVLPEAKTSIQEARVAYAQFDNEVTSLPRDIAVIGNPVLKKKLRTINLIGSLIACVAAFLAGFSLGYGFFKAGICLLADTIIACPYFGLFSNLSVGNLKRIRIARIVLSVIILVLILIVF